MLPFYHEDAAADETYDNNKSTKRLLFTAALIISRCSRLLCTENTQAVSQWSRLGALAFGSSARLTRGRLLG